LLELHAILGDGALDVDGAAGILRKPEHDVTVSDLEGNVWHHHQTPAASKPALQPFGGLPTAASRSVSSSIPSCVRLWLILARV
jgi:hypothetical protein